MRALRRADKMSAKKLTGRRQKKEAKRAAEAGIVLHPSQPAAAGGADVAAKRKKGAGKANTASAGGVGAFSEVSGFSVDVKDARFAKVLDGNDARFGLDPTVASFKPTPGMRALLGEQRKRRREQSELRERNLQAEEKGEAASSPAGSGGAGQAGERGPAAAAGEKSGQQGNSMSALVSSLKRNALPLPSASKSKATPGSAGKIAPGNHDHRKKPKKQLE